MRDEATGENTPVDGAVSVASDGSGVLDAECGTMEIPWGGFRSPVVLVAITAEDVVDGDEDPPELAASVLWVSSADPPSFMVVAEE